MLRKMVCNTCDKILALFKPVRLLHLFHGCQDFTKDTFVFVYHTEYTHAEHTYSIINTKYATVKFILFK